MSYNNFSLDCQTAERGIGAESYKSFVFSIGILYAKKNLYGSKESSTAVSNILHS